MQALAEVKPSIVIAVPLVIEKIYKKKLEKGKQKYAFEIVELAREISEENKWNY